jgi:hypothetical protein
VSRFVQVLDLLQFSAHRWTSACRTLAAPSPPLYFRFTLLGLLLQLAQLGFLTCQLLLQCLRYDPAYAARANGQIATMEAIVAMNDDRFTS